MYSEVRFHAAMQASDELWAGEIIDGAYAIEARVGAGGMGAVYRARDVDLDRTVAIKIMANSLTEDAERVTRFKLEARAMAGLDHPNLARIYDVSRKGARPYFVMQWIAGRPLRALLNESPEGLPRKMVIRTVRQVADALAHAHQHGVVHLDVTPGNVMVGSDGHVTLVDFGLGRPAADAREAVRGTAAYMAPEQADPRARLGPKADVYALGALTFTLLTGRPPFRGTALEILAQHRDDAPPSIPDDPVLTEIVHHALGKKPSQRPTVAAFGRALANLVPSARRVERRRVNRSFDAHVEEPYVVDVSRSGCLIRTREPLPVGARVALFHPIVDGGGQVLSGKAEVQRRVPDGMGLRFLHLTPVGEAAIAALFPLE